MKQIKQTKKLPSSRTPSSQDLKKEIDAAIQYIASAIEKNPKKVAVILEGWVNRPSRTAEKKKAA